MEEVLGKFPRLDSIETDFGKRRNLYVKKLIKVFNASESKGELNRGLFELNLALNGLSLVPQATLAREDHWDTIYLDGEGYYIAD